MAIQPMVREEMEMKIEGVPVKRIKLVGGLILLGLIILVIKR